MKKITNFLLALLLTIPAMAANTTSGSNVYFDGTGWTSNNYVQLMFGHSTWSSAYTMTRITNTNLYYLSTPKWDNHTEECVVGVNSKLTESSSGSISSKIGSVNQKTKIYGEYAFNSNQFYLIPNDGSNISWLGNSSTQYSSSFNFVQTISIEGSGSTQISTYKLNTKNSATASTGTTSATAAYTADVTCSATAADGYEFVGWYSGSTLLSTDATYTYSAPRSAKTIIAKFQSSVADAPVISNFAASATNVAAGDVVTFSCDVENGDVANVVYLVNGEAIAGNEWTPTEAGEYTISATLDGALTQTLTVAVYVKPAINAGEKAVFFDNTNSQWEKVCAYVWNSTGSKVAWPGEECQYLGNNMWKYTCSDFEPNSLIFNNNDNGSKTEDLIWVNGGVYSTASTTPSQVILPEGLNIQLTIPTTAYVGDEVTLTSVYTEGYTVKYYVNGVENGETWTPTAAGEYIVAANLMNGSEVVASDEKTVTVKEHTVFYAYLLKEGAWETTNIYSFNPELFGSWPGTALSVTETIEGNEYYKVAFYDVTTVNIIFNDNAGNQTANIDDVTGTAYYRLTSNTGNPCNHEVSATPFEGEIDNTPKLYILGLDSWTASESNAMTYNEETSTYSWEGVLTTNDQFTFNDGGDNWYGFSYFTNSSDYPLKAGGDYGNDFIYTGAEASVTITVDLTNKKLTLEGAIAPEEPEIVELYLRGTMNDWGTTNPMTYNEETSTYSWEGVLTTDAQFKIATEDWGTSYGFSYFTNSSDYPLKAGGEYGDDFIYTGAEASVTITVDLTNKKLTFEGAKFAENIFCEENYYLRPGTAWNNDGAWFAAYFFNKNTDAHTWVKGELFDDNTNGDAIPTVVFYLSQYNVPAAAPARAKAEEDPVYTHVIFVRMNSEATEMSFDGQWDQTEDLTYPTESGYKIYEVAEHGVGDGKAVGEWKNYDSVPTGLEAVKADGMVYAGNVVAAEGAIEVYNLSGVVVARGNNRVDLNGLAGGVYVVRCGNDVLKVVR